MLLFDIPFICTKIVIKIDLSMNDYSIVTTNKLFTNTNYIMLVFFQRCLCLTISHFDHNYMSHSIDPNN
jgi:hypothetical protein